MNLKRIENIRQKHLTTYNDIEAEKRAKEEAHKKAVDELYETILNCLESDDAYDKNGFGGSSYKNTAWCELRYSINDWGCIIKGTTRLALPGNSHAFPLEYDYSDEKFKRIWEDVLNEFKQLNMFEVINDRIVMILRNDLVSACRRLRMRVED